MHSVGYSFMLRLQPVLEVALITLEAVTLFEVSDILNYPNEALGIRTAHSACRPTGGSEGNPAGSATDAEVTLQTYFRALRIDEAAMQCRLEAPETLSR